MESNSSNKIINSTDDNENSIINNTKNLKLKNPKNEKSKSKDQIKQIKGIKSEDKKNDDEDDFVLPVKTIKRSNSIRLYKRQHKEKERRESLKKESLNDEEKDEVLNATPDKNESNRACKTTKKKVTFLPNFLTIIDVESYKKFNEENTCKDPFDDPNFLNGHINLNYNDDEEDGKTRLQCSCFIF